MSSALLVGATGQVGSHILSNLRAGAPSPYASIEVLARRAIPAPANAKIDVKEFVEKDNTKWASHITSLSPPPSTFFSGLGTTKAIAGSFEAQYKLDHDLTVELAKAAKAAGVKTYVLISSAGSHPQSRFPYTKMKGEIEEHVKEVGFDHTIIVRPGLIVGKREDSRPMEFILRTAAATLGGLHSGLKDFWAQDSDVIAKAAILAAIKMEKGQTKDKVVILSQADIVRLGKKEWHAQS